MGYLKGLQVEKFSGLMSVGSDELNKKLKSYSKNTK